jgi:hypothetical protein
LPECDATSLAHFKRGVRHAGSIREIPAPIQSAGGVHPASAADSVTATSSIHPSSMLQTGLSLRNEALFPPISSRSQGKTPLTMLARHDPHVPADISPLAPSWERGGTCAAPGCAGRAAGCVPREKAADNARAARSQRVRRHLTPRPLVGEGPGVRGRFTHSAPPRAPDGGQRHKRERKPDQQMHLFISPRWALFSRRATAASSPMSVRSDDPTRTPAEWGDIGPFLQRQMAQMQGGRSI